jgi:putative hydrolases of HD superfamily
MNNKNNSINLIFEALVVKRLERTGWQVLGDNRETVGEHTFMTTVISYLLVKEIEKKEKVNLEKVLLMSIFHDFYESRTGDLDKISLQYLIRNESQANEDIFKSGYPEINELLKVYENRGSLEAKIVYEANILALLVELKSLVEKGNENAREWLNGNFERLKLKESINIARMIMEGNTQDWWKEIRVKLHEQFRK